MNINIDFSKKAIIPLKDINYSSFLGIPMKSKIILPIIIVLGIIILLALIFTFNLKKNLDELKHLETTGFFHTMSVKTAPIKKYPIQKQIHTIGISKLYREQQ